MPLPFSAYLFVYGTLRHGCSSEMARWLMTAAHWTGPARLRGRLYRLDGYPGLVPDKNVPGDQDPWVRGDMFRLPDGAAGDAVLARLDSYEECSPACPRPHEYARVILPVLTEDSRIDAWTYIYRLPTIALPEIESGDFLRDASPMQRYPAAGKAQGEM